MSELIWPGRSREAEFLRATEGSAIRRIGLNGLTLISRQKTGVHLPQPKIQDKKGRKVKPLTVFPSDGRQILFDMSYPWCF